MYWPGTDADITDYVCWYTTWIKHKASSLPQPMLPWDVPDGPWQEIATDYLTHKGKEYLLVCNLFSKYPSLYKVTDKPPLSLSMHLQELISQYRLPCKQESCKSLEDLLLDLQLTPIGPNMPSPWEILHNRTFQHPSKPSTPVNMEHVHNYLVSKHQSQKQSFDRAHSIRELDDLQPSQKVLFLSPAADNYIPSTIIDKATILCSYSVEAKGKRYHRTRKHIRPIHLNIPVCKAPHQQQTKCYTQTCKPSHIPKPQPHLNLLYQPKKFLSQPFLHSHSHIPIPWSQPQPAPAGNASPTVDQLLHHLSTLNSPAPFPSVPMQLKLPSGT